MKHQQRSVYVHWSPYTSYTLPSHGIKSGLISKAASDLVHTLTLHALTSHRHGISPPQHQTHTLTSHGSRDLASRTNALDVTVHSPPQSSSGVLDCHTYSGEYICHQNTQKLKGAMDWFHVCVGMNVCVGHIDSPENLHHPPPWERSVAPVVLYHFALFRIVFRIISGVFYI